MKVTDTSGRDAFPESSVSLGAERFGREMGVCLTVRIKVYINNSKKRDL